eukprot:jgi/Picsp_1/1502/NSC_04980-R1_protein
MPVSSKRLLVRHAGPETTPRELMRRYMRKIGNTDESVFQDGRVNDLSLKFGHDGAGLYQYVWMTDSFLPSCSDMTRVEIVPRLLGGGGDGGSTGAEDRAAYLAMYAGKKHDKVDPAEQKLAQYTTCHLSSSPLSPPCVCDELGNIYNKDAILNALISKTMPKGLPHISSRKHVFDVKLYTLSGQARDVRYGCPVTSLPLNGKYRFVVVRTKDGKGHVVSEKSVKEMDVVVTETVGNSWEKKDIIPIYPQGEQLDSMLDIVIERCQQERSEKAMKKAKKAAKHARDHNEKDVVTSASNNNNNGSSVNNHADKKAKSGVQDLMPANANPEVWTSLFTNGKKQPVKATTSDYMTRGGLKYL